MMNKLQPIAREIVRLSQERALTPVIVTPRYLSLRAVFLLALADAILVETDRPIRIDWCRPVPTAWTLLGDQLARLQARAINHRLARLSGDREREVKLQITASIARPGGAHRHLVIGCCQEDAELPAWTVPIHLTGEPTAPHAFA